MGKRKTKLTTRLNPKFKRDFFEKVNEPEKAYWLGYLYNVGQVDKDGYVYLSRSLTSDFEGLLRFVSDIDLSTDLFKGKTTRARGKTNIQYYVAFKCKEFTDGFWGYLPGGDSFQTERHRYPNIAPHMNRHFIRGLFDSYSSVIKTKAPDGQNRYQLRMNGDYDMLRAVQKVLKSELEMGSSLLKSPPNSRFKHMLVLQSNEMLPDFILYLYSDVDSYNTRKYEQLMDLFHYLYD